MREAKGVSWGSRAFGRLADGLASLATAAQDLIQSNRAERVRKQVGWRAIGAKEGEVVVGMQTTSACLRFT